MRPFDVALCGVGVGVVLTLANIRTVQAQPSLPEVKSPRPSLTASPQDLFDDGPAPIVPVSCSPAAPPCDPFGIGCDAGNRCDAIDRCDAIGAGGGDDLWTRTSLTNGFWGAQPALEKQGIVYNGLVTQFYQGVAHGGADQVFKYGGKFDQFVTFNSKELGLWEGMQLVMHAETRFGEDINFDAAPLAASNVNMLYPSQQHLTSITGLQFTQFLSEEWAVTFGKINALDQFYGLYPQTGRGITGFMNASMVIPLTLARTYPLSTLGAGVLKLHDKQIQGGLLVFDSYNSATTSGFNNLFNNGANIQGFWRFFTDVGGLPGSHLFLGNFATGDFTSLSPTGWGFNPATGLVVPQSSGSWSLLYVLQQTLWADAQHPERNIGLLNSWGLSDRQTSPYRWVTNVAVQGTGFVPGRPQDAVGVGYFYNGLSGDFKDLLNVLNVSDLQGVELYYNAALTPWFHLTADFQVVEPAVRFRDTAVVVGLRASLAL